MQIIQKTMSLKGSRGFHLVTQEIVNKMPETRNIEVGNLHIVIKHTSAGLTINEHADHTVRHDFETFVNDMVPEDYPHFVHTYEGPDDMPAHLKSSIIGSSLNIPITGGKLNLGTWQGIYFCEFRDQGGTRNLVLTAFGE